MQDGVTAKEPSQAELLMGIKGAARRIPYDSRRDRFNIPHSLETSIRRDLNANFIRVNGGNIAIATQYPYRHQLEAQLQLLVDNRTPALTVLASYKDIHSDQLPEYFSTSATYGSIQTESSFVKTVDLGDGVEAKIYELEISGYQATVTIPVIHVHNWPDHQTITPSTTVNLVSLVNSIVSDKKDFYTQRKSRAVLDPDKLLPIIHCRAGVGRTGQTIAAMVMQKNPELSLAAITEALRVSRNNFMIQTKVQMETLVELKGKD
ncbi:protein-tyrosine phosphatase family protein [Veronia pacifica]|uniref:protein-tyrosine-phosphatase n=1 Tax=Veronia pacifica TaxID=1080227 RepID=A0A1C3EML6_9GAMM|nr:protein-tyrosine phosphatase family protein [Veronia pacifica]ODA34471.1 tyrosine protein phosphatase [Veronia pacifica]